MRLTPLLLVWECPTEWLHQALSFSATHPCRFCFLDKCFKHLQHLWKTGRHPPVVVSRVPKLLQDPVLESAEDFVCVVPQRHDPPPQTVVLPSWQVQWIGVANSTPLLPSAMSSTSVFYTRIPWVTVKGLHRKHLHLQRRARRNVHCCTVTVDCEMVSGQIR